MTTAAAGFLKLFSLTSSNTCRYFSCFNYKNSPLIRHVSSHAKSKTYALATTRRLNTDGFSRTKNGLPYALSFSMFGLFSTASTEGEKSDTNTDIIDLVKKGKMSLSKGENPQKAEMLYSRALHLAMETKDKSVIAYIQDLLANLALQRNQFDKAEPLFRNVLQNLLATGVSQTAPEVLEISLKLASIYAQNGQKHLAIPGYRFSADGCRKNLNEMKKNKVSPKDQEFQNSLALLGMILDSYARYLHDINENESALSAAQEAIEISEKVFGVKSMKTLVLYNDVSSIKSEMGKYDEALHFARKAIDLSEANPGIVEPAEKAVFYANVAYIYIKQGKIEEAEDAYKRALKEVSKTDDETLKTHVASLINAFPSKTKAS